MVDFPRKKGGELEWLRNEIAYHADQVAQFFKDPRVTIFVRNTEDGTGDLIVSDDEPGKMLTAINGMYSPDSPSTFYPSERDVHGWIEGKLRSALMDDDAIMGALAMLKVEKDQGDGPLDATRKAIADFILCALEIDVDGDRWGLPPSQEDREAEPEST